jgi:ubiquitin carboxyl-terminal hydrolase 5/13
MPISINTTALEILVAMGLPRNRSIRALYAVGGLSIDKALDWLYEHMDDPDIDEPLE